MLVTANREDKIKKYTERWLRSRLQITPLTPGRLPSKTIERDANTGTIPNKQIFENVIFNFEPY